MVNISGGNMKIDKKISGLICKLEHIMGSQTYNPNSYNGWTGEEGCAYTFPVSYCKNEDDYKNKKITKTKLGIDYIEPECIKTMKYVFGANHLYVGDGIVEILNYLEETYNLDFNELEERRIREGKNRLDIVKDKLEKGKSVRVREKKIRVGVDIPAGEYEITNVNDQKENYESCLVIYIYNADGRFINEIITMDERVNVVFKDGYSIDSNHSYEIKKSGER